MTNPTSAAQTPESTGLPAELFEKAQAAATEKGRPIYVYRAERAGRYTSKWEPVDGATPAAVIQPRVVADAPPAALEQPDSGGSVPGTTVLAAAQSRQASAPPPDVGDLVTLYAAGGQTVTWEGVTDVAMEDDGRIVRFRDPDGAVVRLIVGGGTVHITTSHSARG